MLPATACALLVLTLAAGMVYLRSYRPTRVPVVERARVPRDVRAKVNIEARLRLQAHRRRQGSRNPSPAPVNHHPTSGPEGIAVTMGTGPGTPVPARSPNSVRPGRAPGRTGLRVSDRPLVQPVLLHDKAGAARPGSYFGPRQASSEELITSEKRGPWAAKIVTYDGRITLPDNGLDRSVEWRRSEDAPPPGSYLS